MEMKTSPGIVGMSIEKLVKWMPTMLIDPEEEVDFIVGFTGIGADIVRTALAFEMEYLATIGIAEAPPDYEFEFYPPPTGPPPSFPVADMDVPAADCARLTGIDAAIAHAVYAAEVAYFEAQGML